MDEQILIRAVRLRGSEMMITVKWELEMYDYGNIDAQYLYDTKYRDAMGNDITETVLSIIEVYIEKACNC